MKFFFKKTMFKKRNTLKIQNSWINTLKRNTYINFDKVYLERKVTPIWQALSNILGCHLGNRVSGATQAQKIWFEAQIVTSRKQGILPFSWWKYFKGISCYQGGQRAWNSTKVVDKPHLVNTGKKGEKYCQRDK